MVMRQWLTRKRAPVAWALTATFVTVLSMTCFVGAQMTPAQHACCTEGACESAVQADCCEPLNGPAVAMTAPVLVPPLTLAASPVPFVSDVSLLTWAHVDFDRAPLKLDNTPTYVRISSFRI